MSDTSGAATLLPVSQETLGQQIARRRKAQGLSGRAFAKLAGLDPDTLRKAEADAESTTELTYSRALKALDDFEHETTSEAEDAEAAGAQPDEGLVEFHVTGNFGVDVSVKGPISNMAQLQAAVAEIIREVRSADSD